jgi:hypothetical protein
MGAVASSTGGLCGESPSTELMPSVVLLLLSSRRMFWAARWKSSFHEATWSSEDLKRERMHGAAGGGQVVEGQDRHHPPTTSYSVHSQHTMATMTPSKQETATLSKTLNALDAAAQSRGRVCSW